MITKPIKVIGIGAGEHARVIIDILRLRGEIEIVGLLDANPNIWGTKIEGVPVLGDDCKLQEIFSNGVTCAFNGIGSSPKILPRKLVYLQASAIGFNFIEAIHPSAIIATSVNMGPGVTIMSQAVVNSGAELGSNVILNTGTIVEHDCIIGNHTHVATGSRIGGSVNIGDDCHIGLGACVRNGVSIGEGSIVGTGAAVVDNVPKGVVVGGVPARLLKQIP